jgi:hypothetical protein
MKRIYQLPAFLILFIFLFTANCSKQDSTPYTSGGAGGSLAKFAIVGNYLYTIDAHDLNVYDISHPDKPISQGQVSAGFDIETIFPYKDKLYLGASNGMYIFSVADPLHPVSESFVTHFRACDPVVSNDTVSYVTLRAGAGNCGSEKNVLNVYNIKHISDPQMVIEMEMKSPYGLGMSKDALYVCQGANGLSIFDISNAYKPVHKNELKDLVCYDLIPYGNILIIYLEGGVGFYDIADALNPQFLGKLQD